MKVLVVHLADDFGGAEERLIQVISRMHSSGGEIEGIFFGSGRLTSFLENVFEYDDSISIVSMTKHILNVWRRGFRFDVIYVSHQQTHLVLAAYFSAMILRRPIAFVIHHLFPDDTRMLSALFFRNLARNGLRSATASLLNNFVKRVAYRRANLLLTVSNATASDAARCFHVKRMVVVGNGVKSLASYRGSTESNVKFDACFVGRVHDKKGIPTLIRAWELVVKALPGARLAIVGPVERNALDSYSRMINALGMQGRVVLTGHVSETELGSTLRQSKIFVLPSEREGFGLAVAEAMAIGLPCVISDIPAFRENFQGIAVFVPPNDSEELAQAILKLLDDENWRQELGKIGRKHVSKFSWELVASREYELLRQIVTHENQAKAG